MNSCRPSGAFWENISDILGLTPQATPYRRSAAEERAQHQKAPARGSIEVGGQEECRALSLALRVGDRLVHADHRLLHTDGVLSTQQCVSPFCLNHSRQIHPLPLEVGHPRRITNEIFPERGHDTIKSNWPINCVVMLVERAVLIFQNIFPRGSF